MSQNRKNGHGYDETVYGILHRGNITPAGIADEMGVSLSSVQGWGDPDKRHELKARQIPAFARAAESTALVEWICEHTGHVAVPLVDDQPSTADLVDAGLEAGEQIAAMIRQANTLRGGRKLAGDEAEAFKRRGLTAIRTIYGMLVSAGIAITAAGCLLGPGSPLC